MEDWFEISIESTHAVKRAKQKRMKGNVLTVRVSCEIWNEKVGKGIARDKVKSIL